MGPTYPREKGHIILKSGEILVGYDILVPSFSSIRELVLQLKNYIVLKLPMFVGDRQNQVAQVCEWTGKCLTSTQLLICFSFTRGKWPSFAHLLITGPFGMMLDHTSHGSELLLRKYLKCFHNVESWLFFI